MYKYSSTKISFRVSKVLVIHFKNSAGLDFTCWSSKLGFKTNKTKSTKVKESKFHDENTSLHLGILN